MKSRDRRIDDCWLAKSVLCDITTFDVELDEQRREIAVVAELSRKAFYKNARTAVDQDEWSERFNAYLERQRVANERIDELECAKRERLGKARVIDGFIRDIENRECAITEFDEQLWVAVIDRVVVGRDGAMVFWFRNRAEVDD